MTAEIAAAINCPDNQGFRGDDMFTVRRSEFGINEATQGSQIGPEVAALDNGNYAFAYSSIAADGTRTIFIRVLDNNGQPILSDSAPIGHEIEVATIPPNAFGAPQDQGYFQPMIAPVVGGGFIVAWTEEQVTVVNGLTYNNAVVHSQSYNFAGVAVGELLTIETTLDRLATSPGDYSLDVFDPFLSVSHAGHVLVYQEFVRDADGNGAEVITAVTLGTNGEIVDSVEIARGGDGVVNLDVLAVAGVGTGHVIAWSETDIATGVHYFVQGDMGFGPISAPVEVEFEITGIAATGNGNFVVVGHDDSSTADGQDVIAQLFWGPDGQPMGEPFLVNTTTAYDQYDASVTTLGGAGGFVIVWGGFDGAVRAQAFDALGQSQDDEMLLSLHGDTNQYLHPDVAADPYGNILFAWTGFDVNGFGIRAATYFQTVPTYFFGIDAETIDFNNLTDDQQQLIDDAVDSGQIDSVYDAGEGSDIVTLPDLANAQITANLQWDYDRTFYGSNGDDSIQGGDGNDIVDAEDGDDVLRGEGGDDFLRGGHGNDQLSGGDGSDFLSESQGDFGPFGNDVYDGGAGIDRVSYFINLFAGTVTVNLNLTGPQATGQGNDTLTGIEHITSTYGDDTLIGNDQANWFWTFSGFDRLTGNGGDDYFTVGAGDKIADGGTGIDTIEIADFAYEPVYTSAGITVSLALQGQAQAVGTGNWTLTGIENLGGFTGDDELTGDGNANVLAGHIGSDTLRGGGGNDRLLGDGTFIMGDTGQQEVLENDTADGPGGNDVLDGGDGDDDLHGGGGDDVLTGGTGNDRLDGSTGLDTASYADSAAVVRVSLALAGAQDTLGAGIDTLVGVEHLTGSSFADSLTGSDAQNTLRGEAGDDAIEGGGGSDLLDGGIGNDSLEGEAGNDRLVGGLGLDRMYGGIGDDVYLVSDTTDYAYEYAGEGNDTVESSISHGLRDNIEALTLTGTANIYGRGNDGANSITGNSGRNDLVGMGGDDRLYGEAGNDELDGGAGVDRLYGGLGNDVYVVRDADDYIYENAGEGYDQVYSAISVTLRANIERLNLTGTAAISGRGNDEGNTISGNVGANTILGQGGNDYLYGQGGDDRVYGGAGNDRLDGGAGLDRLYGGTGDDIYIVRDASDYIYEFAGEGYDRVYSAVTVTLRDNIERLNLTGSADVDGRGNDQGNILSGNSGANALLGQGGDDFLYGVVGEDSLYGGDGADRLYGGDGNDLLDGGAGQEQLFGEGGADVFAFRDGDFGGATAATADRIHDFSQAEGDTIRLDLVDADTGLAGDQAFTFIGTAGFTGTAGELRFEEVGGSTQVTGDTDGDGIADFMINLDGLHTMTASDFLF